MIGSDLWIKIPGPGQKPGHGNWFLCVEPHAYGGWLYYNKTGKLPTYKGERPPKDSSNEVRKAKMDLPAMRQSANQKS